MILVDYLTGAASDGATQNNHDLSNGGYRSSHRWDGMSIIMHQGVNNIKIDMGVGEEIEEGELYSLGQNYLSWEGGDPVKLLFNETKQVFNQDKTGFLLITRYSSNDIPTGLAKVTLKSPHSIFGCGDVTRTQHIAGANIYRAVALKALENVSSVKRWLKELAPSQVSDVSNLDGVSDNGVVETSGSFEDWPDYGFLMQEGEICYYRKINDTQLKIDSDSRALLGTSITAGNSNTVVYCHPGIALSLDANGKTTAGSLDTYTTWNIGITESTGLNIGDLLQNQHIGIWMWKEIPPANVYTRLDYRVKLMTSFLGSF